MPALSPTMTAGTIVKWNKKEGDKISAGDVLCEVQTDKAVMAYEFDEDGILAKILVDQNSKEISVGSIIALVCGEDDDWQAVKVPAEAGEAASSTSQPPVSSEASAQQQQQQQHTLSEANKVSPVARNLLHFYGIDTKLVKASGPKGTLLKEDVVGYIAQNKLSPKAESETKSAEKSKASPSSASDNKFTDIELTSMRRTIAKRLTESKISTPHAYMSGRAMLDNVMQLRAELKKKSIAVSINDIIVKAVGLALKQVPEMNCQWNPQTESLAYLNEVDISVAVATPTGLITPIIRHANRLALDEINAVSRDLISRAKEGKLQPNEFVGGSFSISNLGMFDIDHFTAVINPPQAAILAIGSAKKVYVGEPDDYKLRSIMTSTLSFDARAISEDVAAAFLEQLQKNLEEPDILLNSDGTRNRRLSALLNE